MHFHEGFFISSLVAVLQGAAKSNHRVYIRIRSSNGFRARVAWNESTESIELFDRVSNPQICENFIALTSDILNTFMAQHY